MEPLNQFASQAITQQLDRLAQNAVAQHYALQPEPWKHNPPDVNAKSLRDAGYHFSYLAQALAAGDPSLFVDYVIWVKVLFAGLKFPASVLETVLITMRQALQEILPPELAAVALHYIDTAFANLPNLMETPNSFIDTAAPHGELAAGYLTALLRGDRHACSLLVLDAVAQGVGVKDIYIHVFQICMREIGLLWQTNRITVAQEHFSTAVTQMVMSQLYPYIFSTKKNGRCLVATSVGGDLHEMGMRMVSDFLEMDGWDTYYLGANTPPESVLSTMIERKADVVAISATISYHVPNVKALIERMRATQTLARVKIMVGGYPFNIAGGLWQQVGADGYAQDAQQAVAMANHLVEDA